MDRRKFIQGAAALFCAPAIVKADNLMSVWVPPSIDWMYLYPNRIPDGYDCRTPTYQVGDTLDFGGRRYNVEKTETPGVFVATTHRGIWRSVSRGVNPYPKHAYGAF